MKFLHLADLHLGKRICERSMLGEQEYILQQILDIAAERQVRAVLIAGDVYDRPVPPPEAVALFDWFLTGLGQAGVACLVIPGNHDSDERLAFGAHLLSGAGVHFAPVFDGALHTVTLEDAACCVHFTLLPFLRPAQVRRYFPEVPPGDYEAAIRAVLGTVDLQTDGRHVLLAHQFVTALGVAPERCDSELASVGTLDNIDVSAFDGFDYVALGHIHGPQRVGRDTVRYAGSPLKFSFSEVHHHKSVPLVTLGDGVEIELLPLVPRHDMREKRGSLAEILTPSAGERTDDFMHITLTDDAVMDAMNRVRTVYPNTLRLDFDNALTALSGAPELTRETVERDPVSLFDEFYEAQNGEPMEDEMERVVRAMLEGGELL
ncbi:MAG: exonuclease SbcCD subunit D [Clostridiaceae bacterium]|nr:exonuclease SbcCD subunit D [Clostridiaceae bacterium]